MSRTPNFTTYMLRVGGLAMIVLPAVAVIAAGQFSPPFGKWSRLSEEPVLSPRGNGFESAGTFNPSVVKKMANS
jgi:hypothetical protein